MILQIDVKREKNEEGDQHDKLKQNMPLGEMQDNIWEDDQHDLTTGQLVISSATRQLLYLDLDVIKIYILKIRIGSFHSESESSFTDDRTVLLLVSW